MFLSVTLGFPRLYLLLVFSPFRLIYTRYVNITYSPSSSSLSILSPYTWHGLTALVATLSRRPQVRYCEKLDLNFFLSSRARGKSRRGYAKRVSCCRGSTPLNRHRRNPPPGQLSARMLVADTCPNWGCPVRGDREKRGASAGPLRRARALTE